MTWFFHGQKTIVNQNSYCMYYTLPKTQCFSYNNEYAKITNLTVLSLLLCAVYMNNTCPFRLTVQSEKTTKKKFTPNRSLSQR